MLSGVRLMLPSLDRPLSGGLVLLGSWVVEVWFSFMVYAESSMLCYD